MICKIRQEPICIKQGSTFRKAFQWGEAAITYKAITNITQAAPAVVTASGHDVPDGWPVTVTDVRGMRQINSEATRIATLLTPDTVELNEVNAASFSPYTGGGVLSYHTPVDLDGFTARAQFRRSISAEDVLLELTTENDGIEISELLHTVTLVIPAADTESIDWRSAVYSLEMISDEGVVTQIAEGPVTVSREVTR